MNQQAAFHYLAIATDAGGRAVSQPFTSNVEYLPGDELPLRSARWEVESVQERGVARINGIDQVMRELLCVLK